MDKTFKDYFDQIYCINLAHRRDRWLSINNQLNPLGIYPHRIKGILGNIYKWKPDKYPHPMRGFEGVSGGTMAHLNTYLDAYSMNYKCVLILEDDCVFIDNFMERFNLFIKEVPNDWDLLYLGGLHDPHKGSLIAWEGLGIAELKGIMATHSYAIRDTMYLKLISTFTRDFPYLTNSADGFLCQLQKECKTYAFCPPLTYQSKGFSDVQNEYRDYEECFKKLIR